MMVCMMQMPAILDWFGWCTWDAFYQEVNPKGIRQGLKRSMMQMPAKWMLIF